MKSRMITNKLSLNVAKTEYMLVGSNQKLVRIDSTVIIVIDNTKVKRVKLGKLLGVFLDENLSWGAHIKSISKKISSGIGALKRIRPYVPLSLLETIYKFIV